MLTFRFAAAECANSDDRPKALSTVLAGGVAAGVLGPQLVSATMDLFPHTYALTYIAAAGLAALTGWILWGVRFSPQIAHSKARPSGSIAEVPGYVRVPLATASPI
jgi:predicted MFS family arabinose efflux permease